MRSKFPAAGSSWSRSFAPWALLFAAVLPAAALGAPVWNINLVGDMYQDGRNVTHPTPDKPAYYFPVVGGYQELGTKDTGLQPPPAKDIVHALAAALAREGYLVSQEINVPAKGGAPAAKALSPPPSLVLVFHWGYLNAEKFDTSADVMSSSQSTTVINRDKILGLTSGKNLDSIVDFGLQTQTIMEGIVDDRFFVMISAYDFDAYNQQHKKVRLWVAKLSVLSAGTTMTEALPALIKNGGTVFGRETMGPKTVDVPMAPAGRVEIGTPTVVPPDKK